MTSKETMYKAINTYGVENQMIKTVEELSELSQASWQKPQIEKNHEFIRYVLPEGKTLNPYTQEDMLLLANNINSIRRESLGNKSPYEATTDKSILRLMGLMGLHTVPADEVNLTPALLKR